MNLNYTCPNCDHEQELTVTPPTPAQLSGPPERCYPTEDGDFEPAACSSCGKEFDYEKVMDAAADRCAELQDNFDEDEKYYDDAYDQGRGGN